MPEMSHLSGRWNDAEERSQDYRTDCFTFLAGIFKVFWRELYLEAFIWFYSHPCSSFTTGEIELFHKYISKYINDRSKADFSSSQDLKPKSISDNCCSLFPPHCQDKAFLLKKEKKHKFQSIQSISSFFDTGRKIPPSYCSIKIWMDLGSCVENSSIKTSVAHHNFAVSHLIGRKLISSRKGEFASFQFALFCSKKASSVSV